MSNNPHCEILEMEIPDTGAKWSVENAWVAVGDTSTLRRTREISCSSRPGRTELHGPDGVLPDWRGLHGQECTVHVPEVDFQDGA